MSRRLLSWLSWLPLFLFVPYLLTMLCNGVEIALTNHFPDVENCIPVLLASQIPNTYEKEAIKAQAVIARTNLYRKIREQEGASVFRKLSEEWKKSGCDWRTARIFLLDEAGDFEIAAAETQGQVLTYEKKLPLLPYHEMSGGRTRNGAEVFHNGAYAYLISVDSEMDMESSDFKRTIYLSKKLLPEDLQIRDVDSAGYVMLLQAGSRLLEGEAFRLGMLLPSADFTITETENEYCFTCKGSGHGLGFSQYGGNVLAKKGASCEEILKTYFPLLKLEKF